jgi:hypothetical protein
MKKKLFLIMFLIFTCLPQLLAQCAMCKTTVVNNVSHGELSLAGGLNFGITYLFATPYLAVILVGFLWYRSSKQSNK